MLSLRREWSLPTDRDCFQLLLSLLPLDVAFCALLHGAPRTIAPKEPVMGQMKCSGTRLTLNNYNYWKKTMC